ncbi:MULTISPECIES: hypothetical protein [Roseivirga]|uniref:HMA domain-containing protein n=1 Tax=Roseivirga echinicomitans TaxID=296218 RepID=A0A150XV02_9BACT|nr:MULTISPECIES: hypothetical protein [Roseivirga]KYG82526.1 hypothetical protein AWN68_14840 [Roseivirga echinicomitans]|tara:strand:+ start:593 stop:805 length:213 start_codon:yes stop_codon:yes gene_type:complete
MVHVFKTSVVSKKQVQAVGSFLNILLPSEEWNFDLEDCDKILRVETEEVAPETVITILTSQGFYCDELAG